MEGISSDSPFVQSAARALENGFTLIDIGCSGGLDRGWRTFGGKLRAFGFDSSIDECARLAKEEENPAVQYIPGFVGLRPDHPFARKNAGNPHWRWSPWKRLSIRRSIEIRENRFESMSLEEKLLFNQWQLTQLADPNRPIFLSDFFAERGVSDIDFIKLDVDGPDFEILHSLEDLLGGARVLGFGMEVNFYGSDSETDHTFHNTDRFMRSKGFDLFGLSVRNYSASALPARYKYDVPSSSDFGRPYQGDALYVRDLCSPDSEYAANLTSEKIWKAAAIFALFDLPDCAAEVLVNFRERLDPLCDVDSMLDLLAAQIQPGANPPLSYRDYVAAFDRKRDLFYPRKPAPPTLRSKILGVLGNLASR